MRGKRSKQYRKLMQQYGLHFGFREPYQVLLDAEILKDASRFKMDFLGGLEKTLHGAVKPLITQCSIRHLYDAEPKDEELIQHAKGFERRRCNHHMLEKPLSTFECLSEVVDGKGAGSNKHRYVVASQDERVRAFLRAIPGVPMIYLKRSVMIMEPMATATEDVRHKEERSKFRLGLKSKRGRGAVMAPRTNVNGAAEQGLAANSVGHSKESSGAGKLKRKRGPVNPNPLSVKKPKRSVATAGGGLAVPTAHGDSVESHKKIRRKRSKKVDDATDSIT